MKAIAPRGCTSVTGWRMGDRGLDFSILNTACTSYCCSVMLLPVPMLWVATDEKDQETRSACSEKTACCWAHERTSEQNSGFPGPWWKTGNTGWEKKLRKMTNAFAESQWESNPGTAVISHLPACPAFSYRQRGTWKAFKHTVFWMHIPSSLRS